MSERLTDEQRASFRAYAESNLTEEDGSQCQWADYTIRLLDEAESERAAHEETRDRLQTSEKMRGEANAREARAATALAKEQQAHEETRRRLEAAVLGRGQAVVERETAISQLETVVRFLKRCDSKDEIVSTGRLTELQIANYRSAGLMYVEPGGGRGWVVREAGPAPHWVGQQELQERVREAESALEQARRELAEAQDKLTLADRRILEYSRFERTSETHRLARIELESQLEQLASLLSCEPGEVVERVRALREALEATLKLPKPWMPGSARITFEEWDAAMSKVTSALAPTRPASEPPEPAASGDRQEPLHLITQRGQPYGSVRRCCERCGLAIPSINPRTSDHRWTDNESVWYADTANCRSQPAQPVRGTHSSYPRCRCGHSSLAHAVVGIGPRCHLCSCQEFPAPAPPASVAEQAQGSNEEHDSE